MVIFAIKLVLAHILGDFIFQPTKWVTDKRLKKHKSKYLYFHILVHVAFLLILLKFDLTYILGIIAIMVTHFFIDLLKLNYKNEKYAQEAFFIDQLFHLIVIGIVVNYYFGGVINIDFFQNSKLLLLLVTLLVVTKVISVFINIMISKLKIENENDSDSLENAGTYIGMLERILIFFFILMGHWEGVAFLLAAKSVFRFGDLTNAKDRKLTEYILIGTLLSFGFAMLVSQSYLWIVSSQV